MIGISQQGAGDDISCSSAVWNARARGIRAAPSGSSRGAVSGPRFERRLETGDILVAAKPIARGHRRPVMAPRPGGAASRRSLSGGKEDLVIVPQNAGRKRLIAD